MSYMTMEMFCLSYLNINNSAFFPPVSRLITEFVTKVTLQVALVEQEVLTLLEHSVFIGTRVAQSCVVFC